jgi:hypothetical protein
MSLYVAYIAADFQGGRPVGIYESADAAVDAVRQYIVLNEIDPGLRFYEVYEYEVGDILNEWEADQRPVCYGGLQDLVDEEVA